MKISLKGERVLSAQPLIDTLKRVSFMNSETNSNHAQAGVTLNGVRLGCDSFTPEHIAQIEDELERDGSTFVIFSAAVEVLKINGKLVFETYSEPDAQQLFSKHRLTIRKYK